MDPPDKQLYCFCGPEEMDRATDADLRGWKVGYRAKSIQRVTEAFVRKEIDEFVLRDKSREAERKALLGLYGIVPASIGYIHADVCHHLDELNHNSPREQKIYSKLFFDTEIEEPVSVDTFIDLFNRTMTSTGCLPCIMSGRTCLGSGDTNMSRG